MIATLVALNREILADPSRSEPPILPDVDAVEWRGVGPYGQGGKGMTGGTPYGRPLVERAGDRDGIELDQLPVTIGPWVGAFPWSLELLVKLQGDIIKEVEVGPPVVGERPTDVFSMATHEPVTVAVLELERARHHLRWLADALSVQGLPFASLGLPGLAGFVAEFQIFAGISGTSFNSLRISGSTTSTIEPRGVRSYFGGTSERSATRTVFLATPNLRAIVLTPGPQPCAADESRPNPPRRSISNPPGRHRTRRFVDRTGISVHRDFAHSFESAHSGGA